MLKSAVILQKEHEQSQLAVQGNSFESALMKRMDFSLSTNPTACFFHLFFKAAAIASHLFLDIFMDSMKVYYIVILLCSLDFWIVKNITGRYVTMSPPPPSPHPHPS